MFRRLSASRNHHRQESMRCFALRHTIESSKIVHNSNGSISWHRNGIAWRTMKHRDMQMICQFHAFSKKRLERTIKQFVRCNSFCTFFVKRIACHNSALRIFDNNYLICIMSKFYFCIFFMNNIITWNKLSSFYVVLFFVSQYFLDFDIFFPRYFQFPSTTHV